MFSGMCKGYFRNIFRGESELTTHFSVQFLKNKFLCWRDQPFLFNVSVLFCFNVAKIYQSFLLLLLDLGSQLELFPISQL